MKKIFGMMILMACLTMTSFCASAAIEVSKSNDSNEMIIEVSNAGANKQLTLILFDAQALGTSVDSQKSQIETAYASKIASGENLTNFIKNYIQIDTNKDGNYSGSIPVNVETGEYIVYLSNGDCDGIIYSSPTWREQLLPTLQGYNTAGTLGQNIGNALKFASNREDIYLSLSNKTAVTDIVSAHIGSISNSSPSAVSELTNLLDSAVINQAVAEGKISDFNLAYSTLVNNSDISALLPTITQTGKTNIVTNLKSSTGYADRTVYDAAFKKQYVLQAINNNTNSISENLLKIFNDYSSIHGITATGFSSLSESDKAYAIKQLSLAGEKTTIDASYKLQLIVNDINYGKNEGNSGSSSNGGGSGGGVSIKGPSISLTDVIPSASNSSKFADMKSFQWADEAVKYLSDKNIIDGYDDNTYRPANLITRAEFVKIIVAAFFSDDIKSTDSTFSDVPSTIWSKDYIMTAKELGIVNGIDKDKFAPNATISRQDMSVILYNAGVKMGVVDKKESLYFADDESIKDYAKDAIYSLKAVNIISGVGDNKFMPLEGANRASVAQIVYNFIKYIETGL